MSGDPRENLGRPVSLVRETGISLDSSEDIARALVCSEGGKIILRPAMEPACESVTPVHELAHEFLRRTERGKESTKTVRETEAGALAHVVCEAIELETDCASQDYLQLWDGDAIVL